jgi:hypothetical protein
MWQVHTLTGGDRILASTLSEGITMLFARRSGTAA